MRTPSMLFAALIALSACGGAPNPTSLATPVVRLPAVPGRPASGYFELFVDGDRGALISVSSPQAGRIEMHETMSEGNMSMMRPLARIPVRDGDRLSFSPGGRHLMIYDLRADIRPGGELLLVLHFARGPDRNLAARVEAAGGPA